MSETTIALIYFSATHVTKCYAEVIQQELQHRAMPIFILNCSWNRPIFEFLTGLAFIRRNHAGQAEQVDYGGLASDKLKYTIFTVPRTSPSALEVFWMHCTADVSAR